MDADVAKKFEQILVRSAIGSIQPTGREVSGFFETLMSIEMSLQISPSNPDLILAYRKQVTVVRSLLISALIEALDAIDRKAENLDAINALLENIAQARRIQSKNDAIPVVKLVTENYDQYGIGADKQ